MKHLIDPVQISEYSKRNTSPTDPFQKRVVDAYVNAALNNADFLNLVQSFRNQETPTFDNSYGFVPILGLYSTVKEVQDNESLSIIAYSRFKKDESLFKMLSYKFFKDSPTFFNLASGDNGGLTSVVDNIDVNKNNLNSYSFNLFLLYYSKYPDIIKEMTGEVLMDDEELKLRKPKVNQLLTITKPARINIYYRDIPVMFVGTTNGQNPDAEFEYGFTTSLPPMGWSMENMNFFKNPAAMSYLTWDTLKDTEVVDESGNIQKVMTFANCTLNGQTCVPLESYCWTKQIKVKDNKITDWDDPEGKLVCLVSRMFRKSIDVKQPWVSIDLWQDFPGYVGVKTWNLGSLLYMEGNELYEPTYGRTQSLELDDYDAENDTYTLYITNEFVKRQGTILSFTNDREFHLRGYSEYYLRMIDDLYSEWAANGDDPNIGTMWILQRPVQRTIGGKEYYYNVDVEESTLITTDPPQKVDPDDNNNPNPNVPHTLVVPRLWPGNEIRNTSDLNFIEKYDYFRFLLYIPLE